MKKFILPVLTCMFVSFAAHAQNKVGIGNTSPEAELDVTGEIRGTTFQMTSGAAMGSILSSDATGNATWIMPTTILSNQWHATGNSGTIPGTHFIGTIDNVDLSFRANNQPSGLIGIGNQLAFFGYQAGLNNTDGIRNSAFGHQALFSNTTGINNTTTGSQALYSNTTGINNTATGSQALYSNTSGDLNAAFGFDAMNANTIGSDNSAFGAGALYSNTTGGGNTAIGRAALYDNSTGSQNSAFGWDALHSNTTGFNNTATGNAALYLNTTGRNNTATGNEALFQNTEGDFNTATGFQALFNNTTGSENTALGFQSLFNNTIDSYNTAIGVRALQNNSSMDNTGIGWGALNANTSGSSNTAIGSEAMYENTTGAYNVGIGFQALRNLTGHRNTGVGFQAGHDNESGSDNVFIGHQAGYNETGSDKLYIANTNINPPLIYGEFPSNGISIGAFITASESKLTLGRMNEPDEGGQLQLNPGSAWSKAYFADVYQDNLRIMDGTTSGSSAVRLLINNSGNMGLGTTTVMNKLDVEGSLAVGSSYSGTFTAPSQGAIIEGNVGIGVSAPATKLEVAGTTRTSGLQVSNLGTVFNRVQGGTTILGGGQPGVNTFLIPFPNAFSGIPKVMVTPRGENFNDTFSVTTRSITSTNFEVNIVRTDSNGAWGQTLRIDWFAWE